MTIISFTFNKMNKQLNGDIQIVITHIQLISSSVLFLLLHVHFSILYLLEGREELLLHEIVNSLKDQSLLDLYIIRKEEEEEEEGERQNNIREKRWRKFEKRVSGFSKRK